MLFNRNPHTSMLLTTHITANQFCYGEEVNMQLLDETQIPSAKYVSARINTYLSSKKYKEAILAEKYYDAENDEISKKRRTWVDKLGGIHDMKQLANNKIAHPILRTIVNKKANMALGKPIIATSNNEKLNEFIKNYFNKKFASKLCQMAKKNYLHGKDWMYATYVNGKLEFKIVDGINVIDTWNDMDHDDLNKLTEIIWFWNNDFIDSNGIVKTKYYAKVYKKSGIYNFESTDNFGGLQFISTEPNVIVDSKGVQWSTIPWIPFSAYADETSLIRPLKGMIDAYDHTVSTDSDILDDMPKAIHVLKGYSAEDAEQIVSRVQEQRTILLSSDGAYESVSPEVDLSQSAIHLDRLNDNIYSASNTVDSANIDLGNTSGIAIKLRYQDAINDANELVTQYNQSLEMLFSFILTDINVKYKNAFDKEQIEFIFNMDLAIDETEIVDVLDKSTYLSNETRIANHPYVADVQKELEKIANEKANISDVPTNTENETNIIDGE